MNNEITKLAPEDVGDSLPNKWRRRAALAVGVTGLAIWTVVLSLLWRKFQHS